ARSQSLSPHFNERAVSVFTPQNLTNDGDGNPCRIHRPRPSRKLVPFGSEIWSALNLEKSVSQIAVIERPIFHYRRQTCGPVSIELLSAQSSASSHGGKCSLQTRRRSSTTAYLVRELISITRVHTRSTRDHRPMLGDYAWSRGSWSLYSATGNIPMALSEAIIATYMTIHMARSPGSHSGRIASPCQEFREGAEILRVWLSGNESARSFCPTSLSSLMPGGQSRRV